MIMDAIEGLGLRARRTLVVGLMAVAASLAAADVASAQYGTETPLAPIPPVQAPIPPVQGIADGGADAVVPSSVPAAVGGGEAAPADDTSGAVVDTNAEGEPTVTVRGTDVAAPVAVQSGSLPFTGAHIGLLSALGLGLMALGIALRRRRLASPR